MEKEKSPAVQGRKALTIPKRSDGMPDYKAVTEFARLNNITTLKDLEKLGSPISGDEYVLMTKLRCRLASKIYLQISLAGEKKGGEERESYH